MWKIPRYLQKKLLKLGGFSNTAGYKVNIPKSIIFLYNKNEQLQTEIKRSTTNYNSIKEHKLFRQKSYKIYAGSISDKHKTLFMDLRNQ